MSYLVQVSMGSHIKELLTKLKLAERKLHKVFIFKKIQHSNNAVVPWKDTPAPSRNSRDSG